MEKKFCSNYGEKIDSEKNYCSNCGTRVSETKLEKDGINQQSTGKKKVLFLDIIRYIIGGIFILGGFSYLLNGIWYGIVELLFAVSLMPFVYRNFLFRFFKNYRILKMIQIILPILLFIIFFSVISSENNLNNSYTPSDNNSSQTTQK